jgi:ABC-type nitrate/sulfonate/bicarbonate transport system substrate-binding protein
VSGNGTGPAPSTVRLGTAGGYSLQFLPVYVAQGAGFYDEVATRFKTSMHYDVYGNGVQGEPAFLGGSDDFMAIGTTSWSPAVVQGKDQFSIFSEQYGLTIIMTAPVKHKDTKGTDLKKFDGGTWCQTGPVGTSNTTIQLAIKYAGLDPSKQNIVSVGSVSAFTPAMQAGRCDITSEDTNSAATQIAQNIGYVVGNYNDPVASRKVAGDIVGIPLTTSNAFAQKYPELTQAIVNATLKGLLFIQQNIDNPSALYAKLPADMQKQVSADVFTQSFGLLSSSYTAANNAAQVSQQAATDSIALLKATNGLPPDSNVDPSKLWTNRFVIQAYKDLGVSPASGAPTGPAILDSKLGTPTVDFSQVAAANAAAAATSSTTAAGGGATTTAAGGATTTAKP